MRSVHEEYSKRRKIGDDELFFYLKKSETISSKQSQIFYEFHL